MTQTSPQAAAMARNVALYPWFRFAHNLIFWQAIWFLFFQSELSAAEAILLYAVYDVATTVMEVPSGYMSDRIGRRRTLMAAGFFGALGTGLIVLGTGFGVFVLAQICIGASAAFVSGTDNALLYESLAAQGREEETEAQEARGWRAALVGLALSAITGGVMASYAYELAFVAGAGAYLAALGVAWCFAEPPHETVAPEIAGLRGQWRHFRTAMSQPVLVWLFFLSVLMYGFSHVPFVFGQPFIEQAMAGVSWPVDAPIVSGTVTALMMLVSVVASFIALALRHRIGLPAMLLLAFAIQIGIISVLAITPSVLAILVLFLRMVPDSIARPFIIARIQPLLSDTGRATYLSLQSFGGRLLFAGSLAFASVQVQQGTVMSYADIQSTLTGFALSGLLAFVLLLLFVRWAQVENKPRA